MDSVLRGPGYPEPVIPVALNPGNDRLAKLKQYRDEMKIGRNDARFGWMRSDA